MKPSWKRRVRFSLEAQDAALLGLLIEVAINIEPSRAWTLEERRTLHRIHLAMVRH